MKDDTSKNSSKLIQSPQNEPKKKPSSDPAEKAIDEEIKESFPASDPPSWTLGGNSHRRHVEDKNTNKKPEKK